LKKVGTTGDEMSKALLTAAGWHEKKACCDLCAKPSLKGDGRECLLGSGNEYPLNIVLGKYLSM
jgi:hypothetical protein